jgi:gamma-glutamylcyclotransferase (GGCT)/AIG2-like uncharacterized protein YtfP
MGIREPSGADGRRAKGEAQVTPVFLFVYGTLRRQKSPDIHALLRHNASLESEGTVQGQLFNLGDYPGLALSKTLTDRVVGEVYRLEPSLINDSLRALDEYEGIGPDRSQPHEYRREVVRVHLKNGATVDAWAYVLNQVPRESSRIPSGDYLERHAPIGS